MLFFILTFVCYVISFVALVMGFWRHIRALNRKSLFYGFALVLAAVEALTWEHSIAVVVVGAIIASPGVFVVLVGADFYTPWLRLHNRRPYFACAETVAAVTILMLVTWAAASKLGWSALPPAFFRESQPGRLIAKIAAVAIAEEICFRGILPSLVTRLGAREWLAYTLTGISFVATHNPGSPMRAAQLILCAACFSRLSSYGLFWAATAHVMFNFGTLAIL